MNKKIVFAVLVGWGLSILIGPRDVVGYFRPKS
jgi:hypothetical protein